MIVRVQLTIYLDSELVDTMSEGDIPSIYYIYFKGDHFHTKYVNR